MRGKPKLPKLLPGLILPDLHAPYHDHRALRLVHQVGRALRPSWLVVIGDLADCYSVSSHDKDPKRANRMDWELDVCNRVLDELDALGATTKLYIEGNHEDRLRRLVMTKPELAGMLTIPRELKLRERGWAFTPYKEHTRLGKVHYTHDVGAASRTAIFRSLDLYQHSIVTGHTHRMMYVVENNALGTGAKVAASFGWLGDVGQIDYMNKAKARSSWALGFGVGYLEPASGYTYLVPVPILPDYSCMVNGVLYREPKLRGD